MNYENIADELANRILALIPAHPEIVTMHSAWDLFAIDEFEVRDLNPSAFQASWALNRAKFLHKENTS